MAFTVKIDGMDELKHKLHAPSEEIARQQRAILHRSVIIVAQEARQRVQTRTGKAASGIRGDVVDAGGAIKGLVKARSKAAIFSQRTRHPGKTAPPIKAIARWVDANVATTNKTAAAFAIARAIGRRGHVGKPVMVAALRAKQQEIIALWNDHIRAALRRKGA